MKSSVVKRSIVIDGKKTSICLEDLFWSGFKEIAQEEHVTLSELVSRIKSGQAGGNFSSALRVYILSRYRERRAAGQPESAAIHRDFGSHQREHGMVKPAA
jgi:predicted DNA-binding ribbon-helix-helix protein